MPPNRCGGERGASAFSVCGLANTTAYLHARTDGNEMYASEGASVCVCVLNAHLESHPLYLCEN